MRIAVDSRPLANPNNGIGRYLTELLPRLIEATEHQWFLYSDQPLDLEHLFSNTVGRCSNSNHQLASHWHAQSHFKNWALKDKADLFWSPRHHLPLGLAKRIPLIVTLHDLVFKTNPTTMRITGRILENALTPRSLAAATSIITPTNYVKSELEHWFPGYASKTHVVNLSSSIDEELDKHVIVDAHPGRYIIFCGSMEPRKNLDRFIHAFAELKTSANPPEHQLVLVCSGGWRNRSTRDLIEKHADFVKVFTGVNEPEKANLIANSDLLVMPSLVEGFGIPLIEAMKLGTPILTSNTGAMPEIAGNAAIYVDPRDQTDIKRGLQTFFETTNLPLKLSQLGRARAKRYSWTQTATNTLAAFDEAMQRSNKR